MVSTNKNHWLLLMVTEVGAGGAKGASWRNSGTSVTLLLKLHREAGNSLLCGSRAIYPLPCCNIFLRLLKIQPTVKLLLATPPRSNRPP